MEDIFEQLKKAQKVKMTDSERMRIRSNLARISVGLKVSGAKPAERVSPYAVHSPFKMSMFAKAAILGLVGLIAGSATLTFASLGAIPGNKLYGVKVDVTEKIGSAFAFGIEAKAHYNAGLVSTRLAEIQTLQTTGAIANAQTSEIATASFISTFDSYQNTLVELGNEGRAALVQEISQGTMNELTPSLATLEGRNQSTGTAQTYQVVPAASRPVAMQMAVQAVPQAQSTTIAGRPTNQLQAVLSTAFSQLAEINQSENPTLAPTETNLPDQNDAAGTTAIEPASSPANSNAAKLAPTTPASDSSPNASTATSDTLAPATDSANSVIIPAPATATSDTTSTTDTGQENSQVQGAQQLQAVDTVR